MRTLTYLLFFFLVCSVIQAQNYYVASLQGEVYYNDVPLQKRDRIQISGTIRFGSQDDWVKLSGPGGIYMFSADMRDEGNSEFLFTVRQELFPPVRHIATIAQSFLDLPDLNENEPELSHRDAFIAEFGEHIRRCQPVDAWELLYKYRFAQYIDKEKAVDIRKAIDIFEDEFGLPLQVFNSASVDPLWINDSYYYQLIRGGRQAPQEKRIRFLTGTTLSIPSSIQNEAHQYAWVHQMEAGLSYQMAAVEEDSIIVIRDDEFPEGTTHSAVVMVTNVSLLDTLVQVGTTIDDAYRFLCSCYGVGTYLERDRMVLKDFETPGVIVREEFEEDMRFHIEVSESTSIDNFLEKHLYAGYIYEAYGSVFRVKETLRKLGLK